MSRSKSRPASGLHPHGRLLAGALTFFATLAAAPGYAVDIPNVPLQSQAEYPPANVMFILDDSGSMDGVGMPADLDEINFTKIDQASYVHNTIYYNPAVTYQAWIKADNSRYTDGTSFGAAYSDTAQASGDTVNLARGTSGSYYTFYLPHSAQVEASKSKNTTDYYRYQFYKVGGTTRVVRSDQGPKRSDNIGPAGTGAGCAKYDSNESGTDWRNCTFVTPTGRTEAEEMTNFATWYSYHRTRIKVAKAGASEAFSRIGEKLRIGFDSINRNAGVRYEIQVGTDEGLFRGSNKDDWYNRLQAASAGGWTPLRRALQRTGNYFMRSDASGPWGPKATGQISCRQNFAILTTDGYWNPQYDYKPPEPFTSVGDQDGSDGSKITHANAKGEIDQSFQYAPKKPFADPVSREDTLADVAMSYWKRDLRTDLENNIPKSFADEAFWQHMVTFGVSIGLQGTLNPKTDLDSITNGTKFWPDPLDNEDAERIDDLWHAGVNGHGGFLVANNTKEFTEGLLAAFATIAERRGSASNVAANSTTFITNTRVYYASYMSGKWSGELEAHDASSAGVATLARWKASKLIPTSGRTILSWNGSGGTVFPTATQISLLNQSARPIAPVNGNDNAAYIKGDRSKERKNNGQLRDRDSLLGDIVNSSPMYVKDSETIFVGANDGMLHAFDALTGVERFAYVPGGIDFAKLATLSSPQYSHEYFVDGPIVVSTKKVTPNKNYLVGTLGRGGKGVYALDVTDPTKFGVSDVMWERTSGVNMGYVLGKPMITTLNDGTNVAIFGNGINSATGHAVLYVVDLQSGVVLQEIDTGVGGDNGLSAPRGWDEDNNGTVDYVFAGDLKGNVWKFDFSKSAPGQVAFSGKPLFTAAAGQPITGDLGLALNPQTGQRWVFAGTGSLLTKDDLTDTTIQSMYALIDDGTGPITKSQLHQRTIDVVDSVTGNRAFEPPGLLPAGKRGWYLDLSKPTAGERVITRPAIDGSALTFTSLIPPTSNACDAGGEGYFNELDAFTGTAPKKAYFDSNGDGVFDDKDTLSNSSGGTTAVGSVKLGVGMPTEAIIIKGEPNAIAAVCGSTGECEHKRVAPPGAAPQRVSWREILRN